MNQDMNNFGMITPDEGRTTQKLVNLKLVFDFTTVFVLFLFLFSSE